LEIEKKMIIKIDLNNVTFTEWLIYLANQCVPGSYFRESVLDIPREELIKKSDYLFNLLENCYEPETVTEDLVFELIRDENWGAPTYNDDGSEFEW
jgi:hypothetical protein